MPTFRHEAVATVLSVRAVAPGGRPVLAVLAWQRQRDPFEGRWALPSGPVRPGETLGACVARELATKLNLAEIAHLEQLETRSDPERDPWQRTIATAYLGLVPSTASLELPDNAAWFDSARLPPTAFDHDLLINAAVDRLRRKLCYTNLGFALAPETFTISQLRDIYAAALGYEPDATNLQRVLARRGQLEPTGEVARAGSAGGRPGKLFRFTRREAQITDPFAVLRPAGVG